MAGIYARLGDRRIQLVPSAYSYSTGFVALDPGRDRLLALFKAAILAELGPTWDRVFGENSGCPQEHPLCGTLPVQDSLPLEPQQALVQMRKNGFPLLCLHRDVEARRDDLSGQERSSYKQPWQLHYILSPLTVGGVRKFGDVLGYVGMLADAVITNRGHPAYENGDAQFFEGRGGFASISCLGWKTGPATFSAEEKAPEFLTVTVGIETVEVALPDEDANPVIEGMDVNIGAGDQKEILPHVADVTLS